MIATSWRRAALAAALLTAAPAALAAAPPSTSAASIQVRSLPAFATVSAFYQARQDAPVWLRSENLPAARHLISILRRSQVEGLSSGPMLAAAAESAMSRAQSGDPGAVAEAERLLSSAWVQYVQKIRTPSPMMEYGDEWLRPRAPQPQLVLAEAASSPSLLSHIQAVSRVNPVYAQLRDAAWDLAQQSPGSVDGRVVANLERARFLPPTGRYVLVDAGSARLHMVENGQIRDSMKVIVGAPETRTPMVASTIYYATLNPYWHVPDSLAKKIIAPGVLRGGIGYLTTRGYEVVSAFDDGEVLDPKSVDWKAVAAGRATVKVRQKPGSGNSMGDMKFHFANSDNVYLHDTPQKELFGKAERTLSNGCIRLEDAPKLARWLMGGDPRLTSKTPEQHVQLAQGVPIFVTYLTAQPDGGSLAFRKDVYGYDSVTGAARVAAR